MDYNDFRELKTNHIEEANIILGSANYDLSCSCGSGTSHAPKKLKELSRYLPPFDANFHNLEKVKIYDYCVYQLICNDTWLCNYCTSVYT